MKRILPTLLILAVLGSLFWWGSQAHRDVRRFQAVAEKTEVAKRDLAAEVVRLRARLTALEKEKPAASPAAPAATVPAFQSQSVDLTSYMEADPDYPDFWNRTMQQRVRVTYGDLKRFNLSPELEARLRRVLADRLAAPNDVQAAISKLGYAPGSPEWNRAFGDANLAAEKESEAQIQEILGKSGMADLQAAQRDFQNLANIQASLGTQFALAGAPMTTDQLKAIAETFSATKNSGMTLIGFALPPAQEQALRQRIGQLLTPQQSEIFQQNRDLFQQQQELQSRAKEAAKKDLGHEINSWSMRGL